MAYEQFEDNLRQQKQQAGGINQTSPYCDLVYYESSRTPGLRLAAHVVKPDRPGYLLVGTHGWHMSIPKFVPKESPDPDNRYLHSRSYVNRAKALGKGGLIRYYELQGAGTRSHWGNATEEQLKQVEMLSEENRLAHRKPVSIPPSGRLVVGGYLFTKHFSVVLDSIDKTAWLDYDLREDTFRITCDVDCDYTIERYGG